MIHNREEGRAVISVELDAVEVQAIAPKLVEYLREEYQATLPDIEQLSWAKFDSLDFDPLFRGHMLLADLRAGAGQRSVEISVERDWFRIVLARIVREAAKDTVLAVEGQTGAGTWAQEEAGRLANALEVLDRIGWPQDGFVDNESVIIRATER